jgi:putative ABC transport system permease protein
VGAKPSSVRRYPDSEDLVIAPWWWLALVPIATLLIVACAASLLARLATGIPSADALRYE